MERGAMAGSVNAIPGRNSAFETGGVQASDEPEHGVGPQHVALAANGLEHGACCWTRIGSLRTSVRKEAAVWKVL